ncbi:MAG TPA: AAA-like domain-containing protein [Leptolyngbyaceae cyanobacterium M65_K2018_010]|nr:AAA-like domain-containing protein [Leptolyngbyaceae cyanobacterium M65_K2018_010]
MNEPLPHSRRKRGATLTAAGTQRLRQAIERVETLENQGKRLSKEELAYRAGVSTSTVSRLWSAQSGVDLRSLKLIFSAFGLELALTDCQHLGLVAPGPTEQEDTGDDRPRPSEVYPAGPLPLESPFYIPRPPLEARAYEELTHPGCVLRLKAPSGFGTSSLVLRVLAQAKHLGYAIATVDLQQVDLEILADSDRFLQWFCVTCTLSLGLEPQLDRHWSDFVGSPLSTTLYLREYLMARVNAPLVLSIQTLDRLFAYNDTAQAFLPLLRSWHEEARHEARWQNLRLLVAYTTDRYLPLDINYSPFNLGLPLALPEFTAAQVLELAHRYGLDWGNREVEQLMALVGGHPSLVHGAIYHLTYEPLTLDQLLQTGTTFQGIYQGPLQKLLAIVQQQPQLMAPLRTMVMGKGALQLDPRLAYQLESMGLVKGSAAGWQISRELYREYFRQVLFAECNIPNIS